MSIRMNSLERLAHNMVMEGVRTDTFEVIYNGKRLSCVFILNENNSTLYLTTHGVVNITVSFDLDEHFRVPPYINSYDDYNLLAEYSIIVRTT